MRVEVEVYRDEDPMGSGRWMTACYARRPDGTRVWFQDRFEPQATAAAMVAAVQFGMPEAEVEVMSA